MAEPRKQNDLIDTPRPDDTGDKEQNRVRSSNDHDRTLDRAGEQAHNRGYDKAVRDNKSVEDVDPDSAESEVDRDDSVND